jgi:glycosyltransferase involved in cell wall biosynthesis
MHLTIVSPFPPTLTGIGQYGFHITRALESSGLFSHLTVLAGAKAGDFPPAAIKNAEIDYCWQPDDLKTRQIILSRLRHLKPDLVWFNLGASVFGKSPLANLSGMFSPMLARKMGYPVIVTLHELVELADLRALNAPGGFLAPAGARLLTEIATRADLVCLTMQHYADWLSARGINCVHIPIGSYHEPELLQETENQELLFFTTLAPFKGLELLLAAFADLKKEFPQLRLSIAGAEHTRFPEYSKDLRQKCGTPNDVQWLGQIPEEQVKNLFRNAQIVILPYTASTGSSSVLYQSATWGRSIAASNLKEHVHLAKENDLKIQFFESGNANALKESIRFLLNSQPTRNAQIQHNFRSIQKLTPAKTVNHYIQAFNQVLERSSSSKRILNPRKEMELP